MKKQVKKRAPGKRSQLFQTSQRWKLSHRIHSGRLLPHAHTSYPILAMILLCTAVLMSGLGQLATAAPGPEDIALTVRYPGPAPTQAATITSPTDGTRFTAKPITVTGTCPADTYVTVARNGVDSGMALCQPDLTYSLQIDLFAGANALKAQVYNKTDVPGPASGTTTVYYDSPVTPPTPTTPGTGSGSGAKPTPPASSSSPVTINNPLLIQTDFRYLGHYVGEVAKFSFTLVGGTAPYAVTINWGDGSQKLIAVSNTGEFTAEHVYQSIGDQHGSFNITVKAVDAADNSTILQLITIISERSTPAFGGYGEEAEGNSSWLSGLTTLELQRLVWSSYSIVVLMVLAFWLGERHELHILRPNRRHGRHA